MLNKNMKKIALIEIVWKFNSAFANINDSKIIRICKFKDIKKEFNIKETNILFFFSYGILKINDLYHIILIEHYKNKLFINFLKNLQIFERKEKLKKLMIYD